MQRTFTTSAWVIISVLFLACAKEEATPAPTPGGNTPSLAADAILSAEWIENEEDHAFALFVVNDTTPVDVGAVTLNDVPSDATEPGVYGWYLSPLDVSTTVNWSVQGGNGFPGFSRELNDLALPLIDDIDSGTEVHRNTGYLLSCTGATGADSLRFTLHLGITKTLAGGTTSCFFTPEELAAIPDGPTQCAVTGLSYRIETIGAKRIQFERRSGRSMGVVVSD